VNALLDTNVIVDVLAQREPFFEVSARILDKAERGEFTASVCATTVTTIFYLVRSVAAVNQAVVDAALASSFTDFEDAILNHAALTFGADCIVTRNEADFRYSSLVIYSPSQFLAALTR